MKMFYPSFLLLAVLLAALTGRAQVPQYMSYQGYLTDGNGNALGSTNTGPKAYSVAFEIFSAPTGGNAVYGEEQTVTVDNGFFSVLLGQGLNYSSDSHSLLSGIFAANPAPLFIQMTVLGIGTGGGNVVILPRLQLVSSPYAFDAANATTLGNPGSPANINLSAGNLVLTPNVGIGTSTPVSALQVNGTVTASAVNSSGPVTASSVTASGTVSAATVQASNNLTVGGAGVFGNSVGIGQVTTGFYGDGGNIALRTYTNGSIFFQSYSGNNTYMFITNRTGYVGIGTTTPATALQVAGTVTANGFSSPRIQATQVFNSTGSGGGQNSTTFSSTNFSTGGGTLMITVSASCRAGGNSITAGYNKEVYFYVAIDGTPLGALQMYMENSDWHKAFPTGTYVVPNIPAGGHVITLTEDANIIVDGNDRMQVTVLELPF